MPPLSPTPSDLHVSVPLTNVAVAWKAQNRDEFVADKVFPIVPVQKQGDKYWKFHRPDWRRTNAQLRAPATESVGIGWRVTTDIYFADVYAVHADIDDRQRNNADSVFSLDRTFTEQVMNDLHLRREKDWSRSFFQPGVWGTDIDGVTADPVAGTSILRFSETASTPIEDFRRYRRYVKRTTGIDPNFLVWGSEVEDAMLDHDAFIERIKYTQRGVLTNDLIGSFLGIDRIHTLQAVENVAAEYADITDDHENADYQFIGDAKSMLMGYAAAAPSTQTPSAGYTFSWAGHVGSSRDGIRTKKFRMEELSSDRIEGEMAYDMKATAPELAVFFNEVV